MDPVVAGRCPVCLSQADAWPRPYACLTVRCDRCGEFDLSDAAEDVFDTYGGRLDRRRLSDALVDVCAMAECERPLIDTIVAATLIAFAVM